MILAKFFLKDLSEAEGPVKVARMFVVLERVLCYTAEVMAFDSR